MTVKEDLAFCLSGGSYHAMFQIYLLQFCAKYNIYPGGIFTASAGGPNAVAYVLGKAHTLDRIWFDIRPKKLYAKDIRRLIWDPIVRGRAPIIGASAIFKTRTLDRVVDREVDFAMLIKSPVCVWFSVLDLRSGELLWFSNHDDGMTSEFLHAILLGSMRIPVFFPPIKCEFQGRKYQFVDAGLVTNIPVKRAVESGFKKIVVIETSPRILNGVGYDFDTIAEIETRHSDIKHTEEGGGHLKWIANINKNLGVLHEVEKILADSRVPDDIRRAVLREHAGYMFSDKLKVAICRINLPSTLSILKKESSRDYGSPSLTARYELLGAGDAAAELILEPFLREQGILA